MFGEDSSRGHRLADSVEFEEASRVSESTTASVDASRRRADVNTYVEIGRSLQDLRRTVYDMAKREGGSGNRTSPPQNHIHSSSHISHTSHVSDNSRTDSHSHHIHTPNNANDHLNFSSGNPIHGHYTPPTEGHYEFQKEQQEYRGDQARHSKNRVSTPYRHVPREYDYYESIQQITAQDLNMESGDATSPGNSNRNKSPEKIPTSSDRRRKKSNKRSGGGSGGSNSLAGSGRSSGIGGGNGSGSDQPASPSQNLATGGGGYADSASDSVSSGNSVQSSPEPPSAVLGVSESIAEIMGQHEGHFLT